MTILTDTGWIERFTGIRCYYQFTRTVTFSDMTGEDEIAGFIADERKAWYGQDFTYDTLGPRTIKMRKAVDSGD